jgi:hypothetical protein
MIEIQLSNGYKTIIDNEDYEKVKKYTWYAKYDSKGFAKYVSHNYRENGKLYSLKLHRFILNVCDSKVEVDHIDHNGFNNQKSNLRICSHIQNSRNRIMYKNKIVPYKGVSIRKENKKYRSRIRVNKKLINLGEYSNSVDAAKAYNEAAIKYFGEFACLNIILD